MAEYDKWAARGALLAATARSALRGGRLALEQRSSTGPGVNVVRYQGGGLGLEAMARFIVAALGEAGLPSTTYQLAIEPGSSPSTSSTDGLITERTLSLVNSAHTASAAMQFPRLFSPNRTRWGMWHWELMTVPPAQRLGLPFVDEVWTTSTFQQAAFRTATNKPVRVIPIPVEVPDLGEGGRLRARLGLHDTFLFGHQSDLASSGERKNPSAVVESYVRAFALPSADQHLVVKVVHGEGSAEWDRVRRLGAGRPDITLADEFWPQDVIEDFFLDLDCYVSLHRSEGFGLTMAQAMANATPVIATDYSGNMDFMDDGTAALVGHRLVPVGPNPVYPADGTWAEPDLDAAVDWMRRLTQDRAFAVALGGRGREHVVATRSPEALVRWIRATVGVDGPPPDGGSR